MCNCISLPLLLLDAFEFEFLLVTDHFHNVVMLSLQDPKDPNTAVNTYWGIYY